MINQEFYINNRKKILDQLENNSLAVIYSGKEVPQISDLETFYPDSNYFYLTGLTEPEQSLVLYKDELGNTYEKLFIPESNPEMEKWIGSKISLEDASKISGIEDIVYNSLKIDYLEDLTSTVDPIIGIDKTQPVHARDLNDYPLFNEEKLIDLSPFLEKSRFIKDKEEIEQIQKAIELTDQGINELLKNLKPGLKEYQLAALFEYSVKNNGGDGLSFPTIAAAGENGTILHYTKNNKEIKDNELVLFDLGAKFNGYCADVSRTFPVTGKFTPIQEKFYNVVLKTQKELIKNYKSGTKLSEIQQLTKDLFIQNLENEGIPIPENGIEDWYYHNVGHSLGLNTHDSQNRNIILEDGMIITCEPGLYAQEYNIGIRIEDDILINGDNPINLTENIPKEIEDITGNKRRLN